MQQVFPMLQRSARLQYALLALVAVLALTHFYLGAANSFENLAHGDRRARFPFYPGTLGHAVRLTTPDAVEAGRKPCGTSAPVTPPTPRGQKEGRPAGAAGCCGNQRPFSGSKPLFAHLAPHHPRP